MGMMLSPCPFKLVPLPSILSIVQAKTAASHALPLVESLRLRRLLTKLESGTAFIAVSRDKETAISAYTQAPKAVSFRILCISPLNNRAPGLASIPGTLRTLKLLGPDKGTVHSQEIDRQLRKDCSYIMDRTRDVLLMGTGESSTSDILRALELANARQRIRDKNSPELLASYRPAILQSIIRTTNSILAALSQFGMSPESEAGQRAAISLSNQLSTTDTASIASPDFVESVLSLIEDSCVQSLINDEEMLCITESSRYLLFKVQRICSPGYVPTAEDVVRCEAVGHDTGERRLRAERRGLEYRIYSAGKQRPERAKKWMHYFDRLGPSICFVVDLGLFDQVVAEDPTKNRLIETIRTFKALADTHLTPRMTITCLLLRTSQAVKTRLVTSSLKEHFPQYTGGATSTTLDAIRFLYQLATAESGMDIVHIIDVADTEQTWAVFGAIKDYVFQQTCFGYLCGGRGVPC
ncbi:G-protein alpha subunit-domain-containing protein [Podospora appendiculata]|uniref:G-protein alpha subunit-domain-containing protein n=1 Tax=Podospora appendiculata TaxID=314037 RepID=A0AAE0X1M8_9PEZI|nr:G-protein alpha subunit-domain-containing protein [Podospora appendiculata]